MSTFDEPISPELVLVSPPEVAKLARALCPEPPFIRPLPYVSKVSARLGLGFALFLAVCLTATVGPFALAVLARVH